ncbi:MAG: hypothetical protein ABSA30_04680, partial [Candidatus Aminicenantales bacterium]
MTRPSPRQRAAAVLVPAVLAACCVSACRTARLAVFDDQVRDVLRIRLREMAGRAVFCAGGEDLRAASSVRDFLARRDGRPAWSRGGALKPEAVGYRLDVYGTLARIDAALRKGEDTVDAAVETIAPRLSAAELGNVKFDHVLGYFETRYNPGGKGKERTYNLRLAASKLDGTVVMPG